ncbi:MAG: hypothetical protein MUF10_08925 [Thermoanaerobaculaceae bacterium]|jgi:hypothetical protein|nr:hypothetical protein [Thermoanaerobaculaceae bacterium]
MSSGALGFASLFLGLVVGRQPVELLVAPPVATVEVQLDGRVVGSVQQAPWRLEVELGAALLPHRMEAVGRDAAGREVARVVQRVNLPRPYAEVDVALRREPDGRVSGAALSWRKNDLMVPLKILADLDGEPVPTGVAHDLTWPPSDPRAVHLLRVVLEFADGVTASREVVFGLDVAAEAESSLTGVAVQYLRAGGEPDLAALQDRVLVRGEPGRVVAVEKGSVRVAVVIDPRVREVFAHVVYWAVKRRSVQADGLMSGHDTLVSVGTEPAVQVLPGGLQNAVFPVRSLPGCRIDELVRSLHLWRGEVDRGDGLLLPEAAAVAGLSAMATNQRRAVVVVTGEEGLRDNPESVLRTREFLSAIGVPLLVWTPVPRKLRPASCPWGEVVDVRTYGDLYDADNALQKLLRRQRIVWVEGDHLPQDLALAPGLVDVRLAGR